MRTNAVRTDSGGGGGASRGRPHGESSEGISRRNLSEEKTHLYLLCQQTFRDVDLTFKIELI